MTMMRTGELDVCLREWRSALHELPELGYREVRTQAYLVRQLDAMGLAARPIAGTGLLVDIGCAAGGPCIGFRADLDALPFPASDAASDGAVVARHACGHDMHAAILLGLARVLAERRDELRGTVRLLFQPAEELLSRDSGAHRLVALGALRDPAVSRIYALHVSPRFPVGTVAYRAGTFMAAALADGADPARGLASFCRIRGGTAPNVRPGAVVAEGTVRATVPGAAPEYARQLRERVASIAGDYPGLKVRMDCEPAYPLLVNSAEVHDNVLHALSETVGAHNVRAIDPLLASEDFAVYLGHCAGAMFLLGVQDGEPRSAGALHGPEFRGSDEALITGVRCFAALARRELGGAP
jgi:metal-dependent amidase/aminoacylase/carboxypeptidase family protein